MHNFEPSLLTLFLRLLTVFAFSPLVSCSQGNNTANVSNFNKEQLKESENMELKSELNNLVETDIDGSSIKGIKGLTISEKLSQPKKSSYQLDEHTERETSIFASRDPVLDFVPPSDFDSSFSPPIMVNAASLHLTESLDVCDQLLYRTIPPSFRDLAQFSIENDICGPISINFCIRLAKKSKIDSTNLVNYLNSPNITFTIPCPSESFLGLDISIDQGAEASDSKKVDLYITSSDSVDKVYLTNNSKCNEGGSWKDLTSKLEWQLGEESNPGDGQYYVYAKFIDIFDQESQCISSSIGFPNLKSSKSMEVGLKVGESEITQSTEINLSLTANDGHEMYITNKSDCSSGGVWEDFTKSRSWNLEQTNSVAKVYAKFRDSIGNESQCVSDVIVHDNLAPTVTSLSILGGVVTKTAEPELLLSASGASSMYITNSPGCASGGSWENYSGSKSSWTLGQSNATATVYVKYKDDAGNESECISDSIIHDQVAPTGAMITISGGANTIQAAPQLTLAAIEATEMYITNTAECSAGGSWEAYATSKSSWQLAQLDATATVYVQFRDQAKNTTNCVSDSIIHQFQAPTNTSIMIGSGSYTSESNQTIFLGATGAAQMYITNTAGCASGGVWENYAENRASWTLGQSNATANVYVKFRDTVENTSACISDSIVHDNTNPASTPSFNDGETTSSANSTPLMTWNSGSDLTSGIAGYEISIGTSPGLTDVKGWTDVGNVTSATMTSLSLNLGSQYYAQIRSIDQALNEGASSLGDGFLYGFLQQAYVKSFDADESDEYGSSVSIFGDTLVVGTPKEDSGSKTTVNGNSGPTDSSQTDSGAAYVYTRSGNQWSPETFLKANNTNAGDFFGHSVALSEDVIVVGAYGESSNRTSVTNNIGSFEITDNSAPLAGAVYVFSPFFGGWTVKSLLKASNSNAGDHFGSSVAISGDTIVVGARNEASDQTTVSNGSTSSTNNDSSGSGAVYVFERNGGNWAQVAYLKAPNNGSADQFGGAVAISGDTIVVGATGESSNATGVIHGGSISNDNSASNSGAAYIFKRTGSTWAYEAYLKAANTGANDLFGTAVAISGDTVVIGAEGEASADNSVTNGTGASADNTESSSGAAYVFQRNGSNWSQESYLKGANSGSNDRFGHSVSIYGDQIVVGSIGEASNASTIVNGTTASSDNSKNEAGAAYYFKRSGSAWAPEAFIKAPNSNPGNLFGSSVSISEDTIAIGSPGEDSASPGVDNGTTASSNTSANSAGSVYVLKK